MYNENNENIENNSSEIQENIAAEETNEAAESIASDSFEAEAAAEETAEENAEETEEEKAEETEEGKKVRKSISGKTKYKIAFSTVAALFVIAVIILNLLTSTLSTRFNMSIDLTPDKILELSDETINVIKNLDKKVGIYSMIPEIEGDVFEAIDKTLLRYQQKSNNIKYEKVDTVLNPQFLENYLKDNEQINEYSVIVECGNKHKVIDINNLVGMNQQTGMVEFLAAEQRITSAIMHVTSEADARIGLVGDHGEIEFDTFNSVVLQAENYDVVPVTLLNGIEDDVDMLIIPSPTIDFLPEEIDLIDAFFDRGGRVQVILDTATANLPVLGAYLAEWGVSTYSDAYVYEQNSASYISYPTNLIVDVEYNDITEDFIDNIGPVIYPTAKGLKIEDVHGVEVKKLISSSSTSYAKMNNKTSSATMEEGDVEGPITLSAILTRYSPEGSPMLMVLGGTGIFQTFGVSSYGNSDFYYNMLSYMTDGGESIFIRPKDMAPDFLAIPAINAVILSLVVVVVIPLAIMIAGLVIWRKRRHL